MTSVFHQLLRNESFVDVTLACNENTLKAHKVNYCLLNIIYNFFIYFNIESLCVIKGCVIGLFVILPKTIDGQPMQTSNHYIAL